MVAMWGGEGVMAQALEAGFGYTGRGPRPAGRAGRFSPQRRRPHHGRHQHRHLATGSNARGFVGSLGDTTLLLTGTLVAVPELGSWALFASGVLGVWLARRRAQQRVCA
jgi:hypothetical protein